MNKRATTYINVKLECVNGHPLGVYRIRQYDFRGPDGKFLATADCDDIDPYARQCHALHCGHALLRLLRGRDGGEYRWSALW